MPKDSFKATESLYKSGIKCELPFSSGNYKIEVKSIQSYHSTSGFLKHMPFLIRKKPKRLAIISY